MSGQIPGCGMRVCALAGVCTRQHIVYTGKLQPGERVVLVPGNDLAPSIAWSNAQGWAVRMMAPHHLEVELEDGSSYSVDRIHLKRWRTYTPPRKRRATYRRPAVVDAVEPLMPFEATS